MKGFVLAAVAAVGVGAWGEGAQAAHPAGLPYGMSVSQIQHYQALGLGVPHGHFAGHSHAGYHPHARYGQPGMAYPGTGYSAFRPGFAGYPQPGFGHNHGACHPPVPPVCVAPPVPSCGVARPVPLPAPFPQSSFTIGGRNFFFQLTR